MIINAKEVKLLTKNQKVIYKHNDSTDYKNYYYYINFEYYKTFKNSYKGKILQNFKKCSTDNAIFKGRE